MSNFLKDIEECLEEGEVIESGVIGEMGWGDYNSENVPNYNDIPKGKTLPWDEMKKWLNYEYCVGYGAPECNSVYIWTNKRVLFVSQYDGSTSIHGIPRNPIDCFPEMPGG